MIFLFVKKISQKSDDAFYRIIVTMEKNSVRRRRERTPGFEVFLAVPIHRCFASISCTRCRAIIKAKKIEPPASKLASVLLFCLSAPLVA